jgi:hypothetical protein
MDSMLKGLFGGDGDDDRRPQARDFVSRYEQGAIDEGYSEEEAYENFQRVSQNADPETMQRAAEQAFARMDPAQRAEFAQMLQQRMGGSGNQFGGYSDDPRQMAGMVSQVQRESPGGLASLFGGGSNGGGGGGGIGDMLGGILGGGGGGGFPGGTLGKVAMGGIAAYAMKEMLGGDDDGDKKRRRSV